MRLGEKSSQVQGNRMGKGRGREFLKLERVGRGGASLLSWGQEMFTACGFLSIANLSLLRLSPTH